MDRTLLAAIVIAFAVVLLGLMVLGWQRRKARQRGIAAPHAAPTDLGDVQSFNGKYVATTLSDTPLERIAVHGLGFRGPATVSVTSTGILVELSGDTRFWVPAADLRDVRRATWTIDRVVEKDGMTLLGWTLGDTPVDSYLRMDDVTAVDAALAPLMERKPQ